MVCVGYSVRREGGGGERRQEGKERERRKGRKEEGEEREEREEGREIYFDLNHTCVRAMM